MMRILCYGASNTWGFRPNSFNARTGLAERYDFSDRWTGILANEMVGCEIIEAGLNGRTTIFDDEVAKKPMRNGLAYLPLFLETHYPLDIVIFMLGTNDIKTQYKKSPDEIADGMRHLIQFVVKSNKGRNGLSPKILVISPQPIISAGLSKIYYDECSIEKSVILPKVFEKVCIETGCDFLDISKSVKSSKRDGVHLGLSEHRKLANIIKEKLLNIFINLPIECKVKAHE